jgi:hypothetical protein
LDLRQVEWIINGIKRSISSMIVADIVQIWGLWDYSSALMLPTRFPSVDID